ncbi:LysR family transcriptional regulator [Candidimonas sp. SYP-B2681]|uniref:LysR substrate-binding domain-containing protein n=1 Tax=Candidimonas sp. SYP-B2681 TaxID=2497686 RepID=UPI000F89718F|nr:LysR substrate-binding domain-containing protein [Candidimonas sp. SYP-B2681]RTZ43396.1 LysR family transcriptional regulator [Candidimonas sp. SYP-B2681]
MNISWLEDFLALALTKNFSRAADLRHMTQPAFGRRIRALEDWLGASLFDRSTQPITLTETGEWFRKVAQDLLAQVARLPVEARTIEESSSTTLRFAATHTLSFTFMPNWLRSLEPRVSVGAIQCVSDMLQRCEALMLQGKVQFVLSHSHPHVKDQLEAAGYPFIQLGNDTLVPVSSADNQGQPQHRVTSLDSQSCALQLLDYGAESGIGRILHQILGPQLDRLSIQTVFTAHLASVLRPMVLSGRGIAWLPQSLIADDLDAKRLVLAGPEQWQIPLQVRLYRDRSKLSQTAEGFWEAVCASDRN